MFWYSVALTLIALGVLAVIVAGELARGAAVPARG